MSDFVYQECLTTNSGPEYLVYVYITCVCKGELTSDLSGEPILSDPGFDPEFDLDKIECDLWREDMSPSSHLNELLFSQDDEAAIETGAFWK